MEQQQRQQPVSPAPRGAGSRSFSFRSDKSGNSSSKQQNIDDVTGDDRRDSKLRATSKANPNAALNEAQPGESSVSEKTTIEPLRNFQHKDVRGNVITDPDLSNPTRPRMERPLDTIRSFEKAIDSGYKRRTMMRGESHNEQNSSQYGSRRNSYISGYDNGRQSQMGSHYGSRRPDESSQPQRMRHGQRVQSDSAITRATGVYGQHSQQPSYDTVGTGSDSTGPWANSTDPSSENSSTERMHAAPRGGYAQDGGHDAIAEENSMYGQNGYGRPEPRRPIPLGNSGPPPPPHKGLPSTTRSEPEKKKSWLSRRLSRRG